MCSALDHVAVIHYDDLVAVTYGGKTVSNNDAGNSSVLDGLYDLIFGLGIKCTCCLVKDDDRGILCKHSRDFDSLTLTAREILTALGKLVVIAAVTLHNVLVELCVPRRHNHFKVLDGAIPHFDVVGNRVLEKNNILVNDRKRSCKHASVNLCHWLAVKEDFTTPRLIKSRNELRQR